MRCRHLCNVPTCGVERWFHSVSPCLVASRRVSSCLAVSRSITRCQVVSRRVSPCQTGLAVSRGETPCLAVYRCFTPCLAVSRRVSPHIAVSSRCHAISRRFESRSVKDIAQHVTGGNPGTFGGRTKQREISRRTMAGEYKLQTNPSLM